MKTKGHDNLYWDFTVGVLCLVMLVTWPVRTFGAVEPDRYEPDNSPVHATTTLVFSGDMVKTQRHNFHVENDEDWLEFGALAGETYEICASKVGARADMRLEIYDTDGKTVLAFAEGMPDGKQILLPWRCEGSGTYYAKVTPYDPGGFGEGTEYDMTLYLPYMQTGSGVLTGFIRDALTRRPAPSVGIKTSGKASSVYHAGKGDYSLSDTAGDYTVTISAPGYTPFRGKIEIPDSEVSRRDFRLMPLHAPDLIITALSAPREGRRGQSMTASCRVKNRGNAPAGAFKLGLYLSKDRSARPGEDRLMGNFQVSKTAAGASTRTTVRVMIPADVPAGTYYLGAMADTGRTVPEGREDNNTLASKAGIRVR